MYPPDEERIFWQRHGRTVLWGSAVALFVIGLLVSLLTHYKLFVLFLPLVFAPTVFRRRNDNDDEPR